MNDKEKVWNIDSWYEPIRGIYMYHEFNGHWFEMIVKSCVVDNQSLTDDAKLYSVSNIDGVITRDYIGYGKVYDCMGKVAELIEKERKGEAVTGYGNLVVEYYEGGK